jgi:hypothetical protein
MHLLVIDTDFLQLFFSGFHNNASTFMLSPWIPLSNFEYFNPITVCLRGGGFIERGWCPSPQATHPIG